MPIKATSAIPLPIRLMLTTIEPLFCLNGALLCLRDPNTYISEYLTRGAVSYAPETQALYTQLAGAWLLLGFNEAVILRVYDDLRLWKLLCVGMLLSDVAYAWSVAQALGGWRVYFGLAAWTVKEWAVFLSTLGPVVARLVVLFANGTGGRGSGNEVRGMGMGWGWDRPSS